MTKRDETVFAKAFEDMKKEGCFKKLRAKAESKPQVMTGAAVKPEALLPREGKRQHQKVAVFASSQSVANKAPLAASKK